MDWITKFEDTYSHLNSPPVFKRWAAISAISGALERKVFVHTRGKPLYPNLYTFLVADPGVGKTDVTNIVRQLWQSLDDHKVAKVSLTGASLVDELHEGERKFAFGGPKDFYSLLICVDEFSAFMSTYDAPLAGIITHLYDGNEYSEARRGGGFRVNMLRTNLNILAGVQPGYLSSSLPEGAWDQGFMSRFIMLYSGAMPPIDPFLSTETSVDLAFAELKTSLRSIANRSGQIGFTEPAMHAIRTWILSGCPPVPEHPRLRHYNARRPVHMFKLCMIACMSQGDEMLITPEIFERALTWLLESEELASEIFSSMSHTEDGRIIKDAWYFVYKTFRDEGGELPISSDRLSHWLSSRVAANKVPYIINLMEQAKIVLVKPLAGVARAYKPGRITGKI